MALTKKEKAIVIKAAAMVARGEETYSCFAITNVQGFSETHVTPLVRKYAKFLGLRKGAAYGYASLDSTWIYDLGDRFETNFQELRVLALLSFAEAG